MAPGTWVIVNLLGGIALLLWGVRMVRTGIMRAWGDRLQRFIEANLSNRISAFASGTAATLFLQSSTATALIVTGLSAAGVISGAVGLAVLLGADIGSALVTGLISATGPVIVGVSPLLLFAGYVTFSVTSNFRPRNAGRIMMGLGLMLLALKLIVAASQPLREASLFHSVLQSISTEPLLALLSGAALTWMSYSSLASILLITSFLIGGALAPAAAFALILGINLGAGLPAMSSTAGQPRSARRLPAANLAARAFMALAMIPALPWIAGEIGARVADPVWQAVVFHIGFNVVLAIVALPIAGTIMNMIERLLPDVADQADTLDEPRYLDHRALDTPGAAFSNAQTETVRMTELLDRMFEISAHALRTGDLQSLKTVKQLDDRVNNYHGSIHAYLAALSESGLSEEEERLAHDTMLFISNLEHAGDIIHLSLSERISSKAKLSIEFSPEQNASLNHLADTVQASLKMAAGVLSSGDVAAARRLIDQKAAFRSHENTVIEEHFRDTRQARRDELKAGALYIDLIRDLHQINSHIVSAAYPVLDEAGLLRETRVRNKQKKAAK
ncbi:MAG: Na/Pi cotransporter family protein [Rhizobiales bacterium]|nr:Na/Pi cotransporter family protein [Hyphomicrobiales bacterium]